MKFHSAIVPLFSLAGLFLAGSTAIAQYGVYHGSALGHDNHGNVIRGQIGQSHGPAIYHQYQASAPVYPSYPSEVSNLPIYDNSALGTSCPYAHCDLEDASPLATVPCNHADHSHDDNSQAPGDSEFIPQPNLSGNSSTSNRSADVDRYRQQADQSFRAGDFASAVRFANHALIETPDDGQLIAFFAQTLFAVGDYRGAASVIHDAAKIIDPSQLGAVVETHRLHPKYAEQMQQLDQYIAANPESPDALFTRAFQLGFSGEPDRAVRDLNQANAIVTDDPLTLVLIDKFTNPDTRPMLNSLPRRNTEAPIVMDGPPPALDSSAATPRSSVSNDGHDHSGHDHTH